MSHFIRVTITNISDESFELQLPDGAVVTWPRSGDYLSDAQVGDEVTLTLTRTDHFMSELLGANLVKQARTTAAGIETNSDNSESNE